MVERHVFGSLGQGASASLQRADLESYGINHYRPSYVAFVFFNDPDVDEDNMAEVRDSFAGKFSIFGHQSASGPRDTARSMSTPVALTTDLLIPSPGPSSE
jgi:hypothetical protein